VKQLLLSFHNAIDYPLRRLFRWRRKGLRIKNEDKGQLFKDLPPDIRQEAVKRADELITLYHLEPFFAQSKCKVFRINLYYLDLLQEAGERTMYHLPDEAVEALDVGCSDWFYVQALYQWLRWWKFPAGRQVRLTGYEADAYRVYRDFHSRYDYAQWYSRGLEGTVYIPEPFSASASPVDLAFLFFPFVFIVDHQDWGLPNRLFDPKQLLQAVWDSIKPGGMLLITNQGIQEHQAQITLLKSIAAPINSAFMFQSPFFHYPQEHYVITAIR